MIRRPRNWRWFALACGLLAAAGMARGQMPEQRLKSFGVAGESGAAPVGLLVGSDGLLYGATSGGGSSSAGTVFRVNRDGSGFSVLHAFSTNGVDGQTPLAGLIQARDGMLYGTTSAGGTNGTGTVFKLAKDGLAYTVIHQFGSVYLDGSTPQAALLQGADGALYGTTDAGGTNNLGTAFTLSTAGGAYSVLYAFTGAAGDALPQDALIQGADGFLYGTAAGATDMGYLGAVFKLATNGGSYVPLHIFGTGTDGITPGALAQTAAGTLYGATAAGLGTTNSLGTIFRINTDGGGYAVVHAFTGAAGDGAQPGAALIRGADGGFYGTTSQGGSLNNAGTVYRFNADGAGYQVIRRFDVEYPALYPPDGHAPNLLVQAADGTLFGATLQGGLSDQLNYQYSSGQGTLFTLQTNADAYAVIHFFNLTGSDGGVPLSGLLPAADGSFYGTTEYGGPGDDGTIFKVDAQGGYQILYGFGKSSIDGTRPQAGLIQGRDGMLYGTTSQGGYGSSGVAFKVRPDGSYFAILHNFGELADDGDNPATALTQGRDGQIYGVTEYGGRSSAWGGYGTIFKLNTNGTTYTVLYRFNTNDTDTVDSQNPAGALIQASDGTLYGTTYGGPWESTNNYGQDYGSIFKLATDGTGFQTLHTFANDGVDGMQSAAGLLQAADGALYGTTAAGGSNHLGTVFKLNLNGSGYQILHQFGAGSDGAAPTGPLIQGGDGTLYGTTSSGGLYTNRFGTSYGTVFRINTNGTSYTVLYNFGANNSNSQLPQDGTAPLAGLAWGADGALYGTTSAGGDLNLGIVFRLGAPPLQFTTFRRLPNRTFSASLSGPSNRVCRIDASTNLVSWVTLTTITNSGGTFQFQDTTAPGFARRFYRAFQGP